jgi:tripartite-type tricarboxylate transporter receptor subunit TctC
MRSTIKLITAGMTLSALALGILPAAAGYPDHPVKIVVPFAPAGPTDVMARLIAQKLSESLKQQFYIENHPGAGGNIGMTQVAKSPPDGYTILVASSSYVVNPSLYAKNPYDPFKDFAPVTLAAASPNILVVHSDFPAKSVKELVDLIKKNPGKYNYAMPGTGTTPHLAGELFKLTFNLDLTTVPFNGAGPAIQSAVAGHTPIAFTALPPTAPQVQAGKLRGLAVTSAEALLGFARRADHGGSRRQRTGIRNDAGHPRAGRHTEGNCRPAQPGNRQGDGSPRREGESARNLASTRSPTSRMNLPPISKGSRKVGQGDQGRQHPANPVSPI